MTGESRGQSRGPGVHAPRAALVLWIAEQRGTWTGREVRSFLSFPVCSTCAIHETLQRNGTFRNVEGVQWPLSQPYDGGSYRSPSYDAKCLHESGLVLGCFLCILSPFIQLGSLAHRPMELFVPSIPKPLFPKICQSCPYLCESSPGARACCSAGPGDLLLSLPRQTRMTIGGTQ